MGRSQYFYRRGGYTHGPVSSSELRQLAAMGELRRTHQVWKEGSAKRVAAGQIVGLFLEQPPVLEPPGPGVSCPHCGQKLLISIIVPGQTYHCPFCRQGFAMPVAVPGHLVETATYSPPAPVIDRSETKETIHRFGLAHKPRETFGHAFGGSFGVSLGWILGKFVALLLIALFLVGGCATFAWFFSPKDVSRMSGQQEKRVDVNNEEQAAIGE